MPDASSYSIFKASQVRPVSREGVVLGVCPSSTGQRGDEDRLQRDQDLAERRLLHQTFELLEVNHHTEDGDVTVHLK